MIWGENINCNNFFLSLGHCNSGTKSTDIASVLIQISNHTDTYFNNVKFLWENIQWLGCCFFCFYQFHQSKSKSCKSWKVSFLETADICLNPVWRLSLIGGLWMAANSHFPNNNRRNPIQYNLKKYTSKFWDTIWILSNTFSGLVNSCQLSLSKK